MVPRSQATAALVASGRAAARSWSRPPGAAKATSKATTCRLRSREWPRTSRRSCARSCAPTRSTACTSTSSATRGPSFDYSRAALEGFRRRTGGSDLLAGPALHPADVGRLPARAADGAHDAAGRRRAPASGPGLVLSAAVAAGRGAGRQQQVPGLAALAASGVIAGALPDDLHARQPRSSGSRSRRCASGTGAGQPLWAGIAAYRLDVAGIVEKVALARRAGAQGVVLFSHESLAPEDLRPLREQAFGAAARVRRPRGRPAAGRPARDEAPPRRAPSRAGAWWAGEWRPRSRSSAILRPVSAGPALRERAARLPARRARGRGRGRRARGRGARVSRAPCWRSVARARSRTCAPSAG